MERAVDGVVFGQIALRIKNVHETTLRLLQRSECHPDLTMYGLNPVWGKTMRESWVVKGLHQLEGAIEHIDSAVRAAVGGVEGGESSAVVADPVGARGQRHETPAVDQMRVSSRRYSRLIRH